MDIKYNQKTKVNAKIEHVNQDIRKHPQKKIGWDKLSFSSKQRGHLNKDIYL